MHTPSGRVDSHTFGDAAWGRCTVHAWCEDPSPSRYAGCGRRRLAVPIPPEMTAGETVAVASVDLFPLATARV